MINKLEDARIAIIGLGYVGLPLAVEFGRKYPTIGFDINPDRISELDSREDRTEEINAKELVAATHLQFSSQPTDLNGCNIFIVAVPTPIDDSSRPDLSPLLLASRIVGKSISKGGIVIYESTVYPGATEEDCIPIVEDISQLRLNRDFYAGYSPERINPGDKKRPLKSIVKITAGSTPKASRFIDRLYSSIISAGTHRASSIRVAEAAKIIENTQRDVNIALVNELSMVFDRLGIDTNEVLDAAATKWNFIRLKPGLVGGHCIGVDPYYLLHKSMAAGYIPDIIRSGREINDAMAQNITERIVRALIARDIPVRKAQILVLGFTFKENCPDIRNTKVIELIRNLERYGAEVEIVDTWADASEVESRYKRTIKKQLPFGHAYQAVILAVPHNDLVVMGAERLRKLAPGGLLFDMKAVFSPGESDLRL